MNEGAMMDVEFTSEVIDGEWIYTATAITADGREVYGVGSDQDEAYRALLRCKARMSA